MKLLHTSDWHAGKSWKGQSRLDELAAVLDDLASVVERERIDLVLMTGDIFDTSSPSADAERLVFGFFRRIGRLDVPSVVIAGTHDSPTRVEAWAQLAELARVTACGVPKPHDRGGCVLVPTRTGDAAVVALLPFVSQARAVSAEALGVDPDEAGSSYAAYMRTLVEDLARGFRDDAVNLLLAHTHLDGAVVGASERRVHVGEAWMARADMLPRAAQYVALGHIHRHQQIADAPVPTWYAGAPLQLDFGEEGLATCYNLVDARPGQPVRVEPRPYVGGRPLRTVTVTPQALRVDRALLADRPHLRVIVDATTGGVDPDINRAVRASIPGVVSVDLRRPQSPRLERQAILAGTLAPGDLYMRYVAQASGHTATPAAVEAFEALYQAALDDEDEA